MTISKEQAQNILSEAMQNNTNSNLSDCINTDFDCNDLHNTIIGNYPLIGFECAVFVYMSTAASSSHYNQVLENEIDQYLKENEDEFEDSDYIDYWIEVTTEYKNNTITAFVSTGNGKHELLSEIADLSSEQSFMEQCKRFVEIL